MVGKAGWVMGCGWGRRSRGAALRQECRRSGGEGDYLASSAAIRATLAVRAAGSLGRGSSMAGVSVPGK